MYMYNACLHFVFPAFKPSTTAAFRHQLCHYLWLCSIPDLILFPTSRFAPTFSCAPTSTPTHAHTLTPLPNATPTILPPATPASATSLLNAMFEHMFFSGAGCIQRLF